MTNALVRARADLEAGRAWKARDRLAGLLVDRQDDEVLDLLATVHLRMSDLPSAGALLFVLAREEPEAQEAIEAWRERYGDPEARWRSIPAPVRSARAIDLDARRAVPPGDGRVRDLPEPAKAASDVDPFMLGCLFSLLVLVALVGVGSVTVVRWLF